MKILVYCNIIYKYLYRYYPIIEKHSNKEVVIIKKIIKHDKYLKKLYEKLEHHYDNIYTNVPIYSKRNRLIGEIDILAKKENEFDIFEVKCSHRLVKAKKQLKRIKKNFNKSKYSKGSHLRNMFFFCGLTGELISL